MDPALQELLETGEATDEVAIVVRLRGRGLQATAELPPALRIVARFGPIATARIAREAIWQVYGHPSIASLKAPSWLVSEYGPEYGPLIDPRDAENVEIEDTDVRRPGSLAQRGRGTVVALVDFGCDFAHLAFIDEHGRSRVQALWDQRADLRDGNAYGYGRVLRRETLTAALHADDPYATAGYHPAVSDTGIGAHGTHVLGIAAGNGRDDGPLGIAPDADIVFVHLGSPGWENAGPLGDSTNLLEALHFIVAEAGDRPLVVNMSIGRHAGPHDGTTLVEQAIDWLVRARPGTAIVQSAGNYFSRHVHSAGVLVNGDTDELAFEVFVGDNTPNELEVWYPGRDVLGVALVAPDGATLADVRQGDKAELRIGGKRIGTLYHRSNDPNNGDHHVALFLYVEAPPGVWKLLLRGEDVSDGRYHAWVERDPGCRTCQALFVPGNANHRATTGSICNGLQTIAVGAYDAHSPDHRLAPFSSSGPTRDGRVRPLLLAPGVRVLAARSHPRRGTASLLTRMSGTSMAAPHVTGTIALMYEAGGRLDIVQLRRALFGSLAPRPVVDALDRDRIGFGVLDIVAAVRSAADLRAHAIAPLPLPAPRTTPAPSEASQDIAMNAHCCGDPCKTCDHCRDHECTSCPCCHPAATRESESEFFMPDNVEAEAIESQDSEAPLWHVVPSPLASAQAETTESDDRPLIQVVPSPLAAQRHAHAHAHETGSEVEVALAPEAESFAHAWPHPVEAAEALVEAGIDDATEFVSQSLTAAGREWPSRCTVRSLFDDLSGRTTPAQRLRMERSFEVLGRPGRRLSGALRSGDLVIRRGDSGFAHGAFVAHPHLYAEPDARAHGLRIEGPWPGIYVHIVEAGARPQRGTSRFARRVCTPDWSVLPDTLVLRARMPGESAAFESTDYNEAHADPNVRWLQGALNQCVQAGLIVDGLMGPATRDAIRRFQGAHGLQVDGIVGVQTLAALREAGHAPPPGYRAPPAYTPYSPPYSPPQSPPYSPPQSRTPYKPPETPSYPTPPAYPPTPPYQGPPSYPATPTYPTPPAYPSPPSYPPPPAYPAPPGAYDAPPSYPPSNPPSYPPPPPYRPPTYTPPAAPHYGEDDAFGICRGLDRFAYDSAALTTDHRRTIQELAQRIVASSANSVTITGYASPEGTASYNLVLGQHRADAVAAELRQAMERVRPGSASAIHVGTRSEGESRQLAGDPASNRRVEVCYAEGRQPAPPPHPQPQPGPTPTPVRPPVPPRALVRVRYDVASPQGQAMLVRYEEAVRRMMALPASNPLSWEFQWYIHSVPHPGGKAQALQDVFHGVASPARTLADRTWSTCRAHFGGDERLFLPWHRAFVLYFERICQRVLGDDGFSLPYWDYLNHPAILPAPFRRAGSLFRRDRNALANNGAAIDSGGRRLSAEAAMQHRNYAPTNGHEGFNNVLDFTTHGDVHTLVGDNRGMGRVPWAANDPIFWLHHCNIDRLWESWNSAGRRNPTDAAWRDSPYVFVDADGREVASTSGAVVAIPALGYRYDRLDTVPPIASGESIEDEPRPTHPSRAPVVTHGTGRPHGGIPLGGQAIQVNLRAVAPAAHEAVEASDRPKRVFLELRDFRANVNPGVVYYIYLSLPPGAHGEAAEQHYVGSLNFFNAVPHPGHPHVEGTRRSFDVTDIAERLRAAGMLSTRPSVTIAPGGQPLSTAQPLIGDIVLVER